MNSKQDPLTEVQAKAFSITRKLICHPASELIYAPLSHVHYIENANYFIRFSDNAVTITNGKFSYYVWLPGNKMDDIKETFDRMQERRKAGIESKYDNRTILNLTQIENDITIK